MSSPAYTTVRTRYRCGPQHELTVTSIPTTRHAYISRAIAPCAGPSTLHNMLHHGRHQRPHQDYPPQPPPPRPTNRCSPPPPSEARKVTPAREDRDPPCINGLGGQVQAEALECCVTSDEQPTGGWTGGRQVGPLACVTARTALKSSFVGGTRTPVDAVIDILSAKNSPEQWRGGGRSRVRPSFFVGYEILERYAVQGGVGRGSNGGRGWDDQV